ncbi:YdcF family protein [Magnetospira sp. QH-2]|uniref:YdcF family protein n=1 Tax=Magnetospira sp. (strain QH-2) TaxID=1288970 RepID=UPI0003E80AC7|nr:YdcF family protein [Magnetospira sp. QH-2]CCQ72964.1 conserved exported protein of unknown function [Magnetospira sp. QH-2]
MTVLKALLMPPGLLFVLLAMGLFLALIDLRRRKRWLGFSLANLGFLLILSLPVVAIPLLAKLQESIPPPSAALPKAVVVLSAGGYAATPLEPREEVDGLTLERLHGGVLLARKHRLPILVTGGVAKHFDHSMASLMARALSQGYGIEAKWLEERSTNTFENAKFSAEILNENKIEAIYLVTQGWHLPRATEAFQAMGLKVVPAPVALAALPDLTVAHFVPSAKALVLSYYALHEQLGRLWYRLRYY